MKKIYPTLILLLIGGALYSQAPRKVLLEDYTGAWCGYCPRGTTTMNNIMNANVNVIGLADHNGDALANSFTNAIDNGLGISSYPNGTIDRYKFVSQTGLGLSTSYWASYCSQRLAATSPCYVGIWSNYNSTTHVVDVTVTVSFVGVVTAPTGGDLRISCILVEDGITGVPQHNYMGQGCSNPDPNSPWYTYPCLINNFVHDHVARVNLANTQWGETGVIPNSVSAGQSFSKHFTYTIPGTWNASNMRVVAFASKYLSTNPNSCDLLNANVAPSLNATVGINEITSGNLIASSSCYPNPFTEWTSVQFQLNKPDNVSVKIYSAMGQEVAVLADRDLTPGKHVFMWDTNTKMGTPATNGVYMYEIKSSMGTVSGKMLLNR